MYPTVLRVERERGKEPDHCHSNSFFSLQWRMMEGSLAFFHGHHLKHWDGKVQHRGVNPGGGWLLTGKILSCQRYGDHIG